LNVSLVQLFLDVAEAGSLSKVAARRQTVQSHVSRQITEFERQCGGRLFRRTGRGVELTDLGERAAARLRVWLADTEQIAQALRADAGQLVGAVRLGIIPSAAHPLVTRLFERLQAEHPGVHLDVIEAQGAELDALLDAGAVDLAILFRFQRPSSREETLLCEANTYLVSAPGDALTREPTLPFARLAGLRLVLPRRPSHWRNALDEAAKSLGFKLLGPYAFAAELRSGRLQATRLVRPDLVRHVTLALPRQGKLSPACRVVAATVQELVSAWGRQLTEP
jgi:LysR family transcriptional regulator, nitrogen assimilation regulatory protein